MHMHVLHTSQFKEVPLKSQRITSDTLPSAPVATNALPMRLDGPNKVKMTVLL